MDARIVSKPRAKLPAFLLVGTLVGALLIGATQSLLAQDYELDISSDSLNIDNSKNQAVFHGNVVMVHDELTLKADKVHVQYRQSEKQGRRVDEVRAEGNTQLTRDGLKATGQRGVYKPAQNHVRLYDDVTVTQEGMQTMHGTQMRYDIAKGRVQLSAQGDQDGADKGGRVRGKIGGTK